MPVTRRLRSTTPMPAQRFSKRLRSLSASPSDALIGSTATDPTPSFPVEFKSALTPPSLARPTPPTGPPQSPLIVSPASPIKLTSAGFDRFNFRTTGTTSTEQYKQLGQEAEYQCVGPMPVEEFIKELVPQSPEPRPATAQMDISVPAPPNTEDSFIQIAEAAGVCPSTYLRKTNTKGGQYHDEYRKCDVSGLLQAFRNIPAIGNRVDQVLWSHMEICIELKRISQDGWRDPLAGEDPAQVEFSPTTILATKTRGQLMAYALAIFTSQYRTFAFTIVLLEHEARLIRWDRAGAIVSRRFAWRVKDSPLAEFLWRFDHLSNKDRGHDITVWIPSPEEIDLARGVLARCKAVKMGRDEPFHKFYVYDEKTKRRRAYIAPSPQAYSRSLIGLGTSTYVAVDLVYPHAIVLLKDSWRVNLPGIPSEAWVYSQLESANVPHVARAVHSGDVICIPSRDDPSQGASGGEPATYDELVLDGIGEVQETLTHAYANRSWTCRTNPFDGSNNRTWIPPLLQCRTALDTTGYSLTVFASTKEFCTAMRDAAEAHHVAATKANILHGNIGVSSILITEDGHGLLVDWDMSYVLSKGATTPQGVFRMGTWQFTSGLLLAENGKISHSFHHDVESFVHVFTYCLARYCETGVEDLLVVMQTVFDGRSSSRPETIYTGGVGKQSFFSNSILEDTRFHGHVNDHCCALLTELRDLFQNAFYSRDSDPVAIMKRRDALATLSKSDYLYKRFDYYLAQRGWPRCDASRDQMPITRISNPENRKRKVASVYDEDHCGKTTIKRPMIMPAARVSTPSETGKGGRSLQTGLYPLAVDHV